MSSQLIPVPSITHGDLAFLDYRHCFEYLTKTPLYLLSLSGKYRSDVSSVLLHLGNS